MPRDFSKPPRSESYPRRDDKPGGFAKPWEKRERPQGEDRPYRKPFGEKRSFGGPPSGGDRPYHKPFSDRPPSGDRPYRKPFSDRPPSGDRPYSKPYGERRPFGGGSPRSFGGEARDFRPPRHDDELFTASGKVADIVGRGPQGKQDMLHKLWDFFRSENLIVAAGSAPRPRADDWRGGEDRGSEDSGERPSRAPRTPAGEHPTAQKARSLEDVPRRKFKDTRERD